MEPTNTSWQQGAAQGSAGGTDIVIALQGIIRQLTAWVQAYQGRQSVGAARLSAAATTVVANTSVQGTSLITLTPTNAAAATLISGSKSPYISALSPGVSFTIATADGTSAAGTETYNYMILNP